MSERSEVNVVIHAEAKEMLMHNEQQSGNPDPDYGQNTISMVKIVKIGNDEDGFDSSISL